MIIKILLPFKILFMKIAMTDYFVKEKTGKSRKIFAILGFLWVFHNDSPKGKNLRNILLMKPKTILKKIYSIVFSFDVFLESKFSQIFFCQRSFLDKSSISGFQISLRAILDFPAAVSKDSKVSSQNPKSKLFLAVLEWKKFLKKKDLQNFSMISIIWGRKLKKGKIIILLLLPSFPKAPKHQKKKFRIFWVWAKFWKICAGKKNFWGVIFENEKSSLEIWFYAGFF